MVSLVVILSGGGREWRDCECDDSGRSSDCDMLKHDAVRYTQQPLVILCLHPPSLNELLLQPKADCIIWAALPATTISSSPPTSAVEEVIESPKFQASDFPALSGPANGETSTREPQAPVAAAPKVAKGPRVTTKVEVKKDIPKRKNTLEAAPKVTPLTEEPKKEEKKKVSKATTKAAVVATSKVAPPEMTPAPAAAAANKGKEMPKEREKLEKAKPASKPAVNAPAEPEAQAPLLSRQSKKEKNKAKPKPAKAAPVEEIANEAPFVEVTGAASPVVRVMTGPDGGKGSPRGTHGSNTPYERTSISELLRVMDGQGSITLNDLNFFNSEKILPNTQAPLQYGPLVHALSALSVGGGTFSNNLPSRSIDTAVSSFQTLLETLTQTISDLLRLLPRTTWDDSSSFDGVLRDMLKGDDFFDDHGEDGSAKSDEVAALTQALERRARWMEVQLSKLEELHRDINTAAVQAVLSLNDRGWDNKGFLPHQGGSLARFEALPYRDGKGERQLLGIPELERKLERAQETERVVENDLRKSVDGMLLLKYQAQDEWSV
jgi:CCR4-NOT transcription complex subunit 4